MMTGAIAAYAGEATQRAASSDGCPANPAQLHHPTTANLSALVLAVRLGVSQPFVSKVRPFVIAGETDEAIQMAHQLVHTDLCWRIADDDV